MSPSDLSNKCSDSCFHTCFFTNCKETTNYYKIVCMVCVVLMDAYILLLVNLNHFSSEVALN